MADHNLTLIYDVSNRNWYTAVAGTVVQPPVGLGQNQSVALTLKLVKSGVQYQPTGSLDWSRSGIKALNAITSGYLVTLGTPTLSGTGATAAYTFTFTVDSTELRAFILEYLPNYTQTNYALELFEATNSIATLPALGLTIYPDYTYTGTTPTSANGTINVTAGKTVTFPQSLTFPSALGTNGFQLTTDGAGALTWAAGSAPGGSTTQVQYNNAGSFAGITGATTNGTALTLTAPVLGTPTSGTLTNCTGLPVSGITASTTTAIGVGSIEIGHATANTLTASSGVLSIEDKPVLDQTNTLAGITNKTFVAPALGAATATSINGAAFNTGTSTGSKYISFGGGQSYINLEGNNADYGYINTSGGYGGYISTAGSGNDSGGGGYITTAGNGTARGGNIDTRPNGATAGGNINTSYGGSINTSSSGGSIYTSGGGGSISTAGTGSIELGSVGTRTYFTGNATSDRGIGLPNASGEVLLDSNTATITNKSIAATQLTGNVAIARIATALTTPGAIGGTTPSTGAFTTISGTSTLTLGVVSSTAGTIVLRNASNAFTTTIVPSVVTANRQLNLPLITGTDTVAVLGLTQTFTGNKTFSGTVSCGSTLAVTQATTLTGGLNVGPQYGALLTTTSGLTDCQGSATLTLGSNGPSVYGPGPIAWFSFNDAAAGTVYFPVWGTPPP